MKTFKKHLNELMKDKEFKKLYDEEKELLHLALQIQETRQKAGISQEEIAVTADLTQQQVSKIENGTNCNILTYLKACHALGISLTLQPNRSIKKRRNISRPSNKIKSLNKAKSSLSPKSTK